MIPTILPLEHSHSADRNLVGQKTLILGKLIKAGFRVPSEGILQGNIEEALRGQPAGPGIARGRARIILKSSDLFAFKKGEILGCDSVDPNMTFAIPLSAAIVERRGGMLVHGAIIAREYGVIH